MDVFVKHLCLQAIIRLLNQGSKLTVASSKFATWKFNLLPCHKGSSKRLLPGNSVSSVKLMVLYRTNSTILFMPSGVRWRYWLVKSSTALKNLLPNTLWQRIFKTDQDREDSDYNQILKVIFLTELYSLSRALKVQWIARQVSLIWLIQG